MNLSLQNQWAELQQKLSQIWDSKFSLRFPALAYGEQRVVRIAAIILPLILILFGILLPAADKTAQLRSEVAQLATPGP